MKVLISDYHDSAKCMWCEKTGEAVSIQFDGGFLNKGELCWKCLQQATRVHHSQQTAGPRTDKPNKSEPQ